jgi:hypothetical protein
LTAYAGIFTIQGSGPVQYNPDISDFEGEQTTTTAGPTTTTTVSLNPELTFRVIWRIGP